MRASDAATVLQKMADYVEFMEGEVEVFFTGADSGDCVPLDNAQIEVLSRYNPKESNDEDVDIEFNSAFNVDDEDE